jgi:hypothetical protein
MADEDLAAADRGVGGELLGKPGLADAGLADDDSKRALAGNGGVVGGLKLAQLRLAADEGAAVHGVIGPLP